MPGKPLILAAMLLAGPSGCGRDSASPPVRARIVISTEEGYHLREVTFNTLTNPDQVDGEVARLIGNAVLDLNQEKEVLVGSSPEDVYLDSGESVDLEYTVRGGVLSPLNFDSMAMLTIYYHYEKTMEFWRDNLNLSFSDFGKRRLFFDPDIGARSSIGSVTNSIKLNAAFLPGVRDFWFFKTSPIEKIPFKMNLAILAHEFSHGIFDYRCARGNAKFYETSEPEAEAELSGINEGIADYFSWMVTGRESEFVESLEEFAKERVLPVSWTTFSLIRDPGQCSGSFYCKGSVLASALYEVAKVKNVGNVEVGKHLYDALETFAADWEAHKNDKNFDYHYLLLRILEKAGDTHKASYCESFLKWFDDSTNSEKVKQVCTSGS